MKQSQLIQLLMNQSKDLVWMINLDLQLIYANKSYQKLIKEVTGFENKLNESVLLEGLPEGYTEKWKIYYERAFKGEYFEIEEQYYHTESNEIRYSQNTFNPLTDDDDKIIAVACHSKDITTIVKKRSEANQMMDASLDVFCTINEKGNFVYLSAASLDHWGYLPEELIGKPYMDMILEEDIPKTNEVDAAILSGKEIKSFANRYKKKDGSIAYNLWSARWDDTDKLMYCVARDGKEKIEQEELILQSEQRFKALVQEGSDLIGILDAEGNYTYVSPTSYSILGMKPEEFIGKSPFEFIHPDDLERTLASLQKIATENIVIVEPFRFQNDKKEWRWLETVLTNMVDNPAINGIVANSRDITDKIEEKNKLKLLESVITNTKDAILITEAEAIDEPGPMIIFVNEAFTKMTGYEANDVIGKSPRILQGPKSSHKELSKMNTAIKNRQPYEITTINYKKNGEEYWVNFTITPVANLKGFYTHWIAVQRDVTEQKTKELENELMNQITEIFNKSYGHDLKDSLTKLCKQVAKFGDFEFAEMWLPAIDSKTINLVTNYFENQAGKIFYEATKNIKSCALGEGMAGYVWENKKIAIWNNQEGKWLTKRKVAAKKVGIVAMMGVPLKHKEEVIGILLLGTEKTKAALVRYSNLLQKLESNIGVELSRKKIEIELAQIFDFTPDMICVSGFDGYLKRVNPAGLKLLGYSLEEMLSQPVRSFIHEQDKSLTKEKQKLLYEGGNINNFENRYITKDGNVVWLSWTATSSPEQGIVYAVAKNITEEKKLRELNRMASEMVKIGSWEVNLVKQSLFWSDEVHHMHETDPNLFVPNLKEGIKFYREDFREMVKLNVEKAIATGEPFDYEAIIVTAKNKELWVRSIGNSEFENGKCIRIYGSFQDIDERKKAKIKLAESENRFRTILEAEPECIKLLGPTGNIVMMNPAGLEMIEADNEEAVLGKSVHEIILPEHRKAFTKLINNNFKGESGKLIFEIKGLKGTRRWMETHAVPMKNEQGDIISSLGVTRDITEHKVAEKSLRHSEEKNSLIMNAALDAIVNIDVNGKVIFWNPQAEKIFGWQQNEIMGQKLSNYIIPEKLRSRHDMGMSHYRVTGEAKIFNSLLELIAVNKEGELFPVELTVIPIKQGKEEFFCAFIRDITQRRYAEQEKNSLQATLENSLNEIYIFDAETLLFSYVNKGALHNLGYSTQEIKTLTPLHIKPDHTLTSFKQLISPLVTNEKEKIIFFTNHKRKDGSLYPVEVHLQLVTESKKKRFLAIILDITESRKAEQRILQANERFEKVTEATNDAIWDWDIVNQTYYRSNAIDNFFGRDASKKLNENDFWKDNFHPDDLAKIKDSIAEAFDNPLTNRWELEYRVFNENKKILYIIDRGIIIRNNEGKPIRMVGAMTNITEQKQMTLQLSELNQSLQQYALELERSNEELEQFAFVASHDLQEPLRMISSFMDLLQRKYGDLIDQKGHEYIYFATDGAKRMKQIILDLLEYSRTNKPTEGKEKVDTNEILSDFKLLRRKSISEKNATIIVNELPILNTNKAAITQVLHCILDNALKYSKNNTPPIVEITHVEKENEWEFAIKDNGIGIDPEFYEKIFVIFQRLHNRDKYEGTGIGLSIAKRHVQFLGGRIWLESTPGEGTIFYFTIPKM